MIIRSKNSNLRSPSSVQAQCSSATTPATRVLTVGLLTGLLFVVAGGSNGFAFQDSGNSLRSQSNAAQEEAAETRIARRIQEKVQLLQSSTGTPLELTSPSFRGNVESIAAGQERANQSISDDPAEWPRVKAINSRIESLKTIVDQRNADAQKAKASQLEFEEIIARMKAEAEMNSAAVDSESSKNPASTELAPLRPTTPSTLPPGNSQPPSNLQPLTNTKPLPSAESPETSPTDMGHTEINSPQGVPIISTPVNSFELANSLLATKNYKQALKSYQALLKEKNSLHDTNWIRCLMANCFRMQGDTSKAEVLYRDVLESKEKSHTAVYAKWFLDHLTQRRKINEQLQTLDNELQANMTESSQ